MKHALLFEANGIQRYLFASGRLRDVAGASELLDRLTSGKGNLLDTVCEAAGLNGRVAFSRRAGGAFYAFSDDRAPLEALRDLWTLAVQQYAPGLAYSLGMGRGNDAAEAFHNARRALMADASRLRPRLPAAAPVTERSRRTGEAAEHEDKKAGKIDAASQRRKRFADLAKASFLDRYAPDDAGLGWRDWPRNLESDAEDGAFPFQDENRTIALIHADGNGLGQLLIRLQAAAKKRPDRFITYFQRFSELVETITQTAAKTATEQVLLPAREKGSECLAARPILLGGDDIIVLVRADLALRYCRVFAEAFEQASREALRRLGQEEGIEELPARLTLGFGVVYMRASQPFYLASHLAESLIAHAKKKAKAIDRNDPPASLAFHRVTTSLVGDYKQIVERELTHQRDGQTFIDTLGAYFLSDGREPALAGLEELAALLGRDDMARGPTRQLMTLMGHPGIQAEQRYRRWRQLMEDKQTALRQFDDLLSRLAGEQQHDGLPYARKENNEPWRTPLGDALALMGAGHRPETETMEIAA